MNRVRFTVALTLAIGFTTDHARARFENLATLWPRNAGAAWNYAQIAATWQNGTSTFTTRPIRFELGAPEPRANGDTLHSLTVIGAASDPALLSQLRVARPDASVPMPAAATSGVALHDAAHLHIAAHEIAAYDPAGARAWSYLEIDAEPGRAFRLQIVPAIADSVFLDGVVAGTTGISTPAGSFAAAVRVRYVIDFGWSALPGRPGDAIHAVTRGEMFFAPGVGPVLARETFVPAWETRGTPPAAPFDSSFAELQLLAYVPTPTRVQDASWSAIKRRFR